MPVLCVGDKVTVSQDFYTRWDDNWEVGIWKDKIYTNKEYFFPRQLIEKSVDQTDGTLMVFISQQTLLLEIHTIYNEHRQKIYTSASHESKFNYYTAKCIILEPVQNVYITLPLYLFQLLDEAH